MQKKMFHKQQIMMKSENDKPENFVLLGRRRTAKEL